MRKLAIIKRYFYNMVNNLVPVEVAKEAESINGHKEHTDQETAGQILSLLSEIGSNEMLTCDKEKFEPWFWEPSAGRLMTV